MRFRKLAVGLCVVTVMNTVTPTVKVFADKVDTQIRVNKFVGLESEKSSQYDELYKIDKSNIESITTNGKNSSGGPIENAVDGDIETFWHTGKLNSDTFTNEVIVEFKENVDIDRIVYGNRRGIDRGFAEEFSIYGASSNDSEFVKIAQGEHKNTQDFLEIDFEKTNVKKVKFVFDKGTSNWASACEIWFYKEDEVASKMNRLFTDDTLSVVNNEFNTVEKIQALEKEVKSHLLYDVYKVKLEDAKALVENEKVVATQAKMKLFDDYDNKEYNNVFKMDNSNIESIKNNAGNNVGKYITNAIDEDINTEWASKAVNTDTFKNEIEIILKEKIELNRVVYGARQSDSKGFAEEFEIYGSKTTSGDTYELISTGKYNTVKGLVEAKFNSSEFKRIKFKFKKGKDNWATLSEIAFYKEDLISDKMDRLFTDDTLSAVSEEFNSVEKIEALENEVKSHPLYENINLN